MLQTLFYIPGELFGQPVFGFGLLLAVWAVVSAVVLAVQFRRGGFDANTLSYAQVLAVLGLAIVLVLPALCDPRGLPIRGYGMMMLLAVLSGMGLAVYRARRVGVDPEMIFALAFWMIIPGILGARIVYVAEYWQRDFLPNYDPDHLGKLVFAIVNVAAGGLVVYGSFVGGMIGLGLFWWRYRIPLLATADLIAPSMLLGLALGRVGCMLNGCCFGGPCDLPWKVTFPWNSPVQQQMAKDGVTGIYGLRFDDGPDNRPVVATVDSGSPADQAGLKTGTEISAINGVDVAARGQASKATAATGCSCSQGGERPTARELAANAVLRIDKLDIVLRRKDGDRVDWTVDDPPQSSVDGPGTLKIYGLELAGDNGQPAVVSHVRRGSPEAAAGIQSGARVLSVSDRGVSTIGQLRGLLDEHRRQPWVLFGVQGRAEPIRLNVDRPLPQSLPVHPTQLYSTIDALILCFLLLAYDPFRRRDGALTAIMMTVEPITRFLIEGIRTDEAAIWGTPFTISQNISLAFLAVAIGLWIYTLRRPPKLAFTAAA